MKSRRKPKATRRPVAKRLVSKDHVSHARVKWPPPFVEYERGKPRRAGEAMMMRLERFEGDRALKGYHYIQCCECDFRHMFTFELFPGDIEKGGKQPWWLKVRAYPDGDTRLPQRLYKEVVKVKKRRAAWRKRER